MKRTILVVAIITALMAWTAPAPVGAAGAGSSSTVIPLGTTVHHGKLVQGFAFVHGRADIQGASRGKQGDSLYKFLARGAKWRTVEPYVMKGGSGVSGAELLSAMDEAATTWEATVTPTDIFGSGSVTNQALSADWTAPDDVNEVYFSSTGFGSRTIAVTIVWGVFGGPIETREIIEWDMVFNGGLAEPWGDASSNTGVWDVQNIATHELGHSAGLGDLYSVTAAEQTMYGYASVGETKKRTLESGDVAGIKALYQ